MFKELREPHGWTQEHIAKRAQIRQSYLAMLQSGERKSPSLDVLKRLAKPLKVSVAELAE